MKYFISRAYALCICIFVLLCACSGCSSMKHMFSSKDASAKKALQPLPLVDFKPLIGVKLLWSAHLGKGERIDGVYQRPVVADGHVYAAAYNRGVYAFDVNTGKKLWHYLPPKVKGRSPFVLSGGPGVGDGLVVVGSLQGEVIALNAADGTEKWRAHMTNEVISAPAIDQNLVIVRSNDGRTAAFDVATGVQRWVNDYDMPSLTLRGNAPPVMGPGVVFVGNDDGTLRTLSLQDGHLLWDQAIGSPDGRTEFERLADVDGAPLLEQTNLYASSYKNTTVAIDGPTGRVLWTSAHGGASGLVATSSFILVTDPTSVVWGLDKITGSAVWSQPGLARRWLTAPAVQDDYVVVGDYKGYIHWLRDSDGAFAARSRLGHDPIRAQPVVTDSIVLVQTTHGTLGAFQLTDAK